jgi:hypothetical protein
MLRRAGDTYRQGQERVDGTFALAGRVQQTELGNLYPGASDLSLDTYCGRLEDAGGGVFTVVLGSWQLHHPTLWCRLSDVTAQLRSIVCPEGTGPVDFDCFLGTYDRTPSGIHRDGAFSFFFGLDIRGRRDWLCLDRVVVQSALRTVVAGTVIEDLRATRATLGMVNLHNDTLEKMLDEVRRSGTR